MPAFDALLHKSFFAFLLGGYVSLITVINPASKVPLFVSLTSHLPAPRRRRIAGKACLYALAILAISLFAGGLILLLGPDGTDALTRLMGFLLICIGVQFIGSGVRTFVAGL